MFIFLNEKEKREQRGNLELKYLSSMTSTFLLSLRSKLLILYGWVEVSNVVEISGI